MHTLILIIFATAIVYLYFGVEQLFLHKRLWYGFIVGGFFFSLSINLMMASAHFSGILVHFPWAHQAHMPFYYILGPLFYLIFFYSDGRHKLFHKRSYFHLLAPLFSVILLAPYYILPVAQKVDPITANMGMGLHWTEYVEQFGGLVLIFYIIRTYYDYLRRRVWSKNAILFFYLTSFVIVIEVLMMALAFFIQSRFLFMLTLTFQLLYITIVYFLARIFPGYFARLAVAASSYRNSSLKTLDNLVLSQRLQNLLEKKVYLNADLSGYAFSQELGISARQLSEFLHKTYGENFRTFINRLRVDYAKTELLLSPDKKIIEVAFESGFNSLSVFNSAYKDFTGLTPRQYRKLQSKKTS